MRGRTRLLRVMNTITYPEQGYHVHPRIHRLSSLREIEHPVDLTGAAGSDLFSPVQLIKLFLENSRFRFEDTGELLQFDEKPVNSGLGLVNRL